jgi:REP element-mobilizing transposase RayT
MPYDPERHHRRSIRLKGYDYSQPGGYFITIVTRDRACLFGEVVDGEMRLNDVGHMVHQQWADLPNRFPNIDLDAFIVMPNHIHGVIVITDAPTVGAGSPRPYTSRATLGQVVAYFKYQSTKRINAAGGTPGVRLWQRNYYEHIIRSEDSLNRIRQYIADNPARWAFDRENPEATTLEPEARWQH